VGVTSAPDPRPTSERRDGIGSTDEWAGTEQADAADVRPGRARSTASAAGSVTGAAAARAGTSAPVAAALGDRKAGPAAVGAGIAWGSGTDSASSPDATSHVRGGARRRREPSPPVAGGPSRGFGRPRAGQRYATGVRGSPKAAATSAAPPLPGRAPVTSVFRPLVALAKSQADTQAEDNSVPAESGGAQRPGERQEAWGADSPVAGSDGARLTSSSLDAGGAQGLPSQARAPAPVRLDVVAEGGGYPSATRGCSVCPRVASPDSKH